MKIICIGDSLTRGHGVPNSSNWVSLANSRLDAQILNFGISGDTTGGILARFQNDVLKNAPDIVFIMGGGNDFRSGCPPFVPQANIMAMVYEAQSRGILPILGLAIPADNENLAPQWKNFPHGGRVEDNKLEYRTWLIDFAKVCQIPTIDYRPLFLKEDGVSPIPELYSDGLHPTKEGHKLMADEFCRVLMKLTENWENPIKEI